MRKQTKLALGLAAAALLAVGASMTSFAARGWVAEGDQWYYYDNNGDYVTDKWKSYNGNYFYLGDEGYMLTNELIEDGNNYYYVDANGAMVKNTWVAVPADDSEDQDVEYRWYYFGANGKAYRDAKKKTINGKKYGFDEEAKMLFGFVRDGQCINDEDDAILNCDHYYGSNDDGAMYTGWLLYQDALDASGYDDEFYWFWFDSKGEKYDNAAKKKKINGKHYAFDGFGVMLYEWVDTVTIGSTTLGWFNAAEDGHLAKSTWIWASEEDVLNNGDDDNRWWYADKHGDLITNQTKKINGKWYAFDSYGRMKWGFVWTDHVSVKNTEKFTELTAKDPAEVSYDDVVNEKYGENLYLFSLDEEKDGSAKTGQSIKVELYDDDYTMGFDKNTALAIHGVEKNKLYNHGILETASDNRYAPATVKIDGTDKTFLVSGNGTRVKAGTRTYKDSDDIYWYVTGDDKAGYTLFYADTAAAAKLAKDGEADKDGNVCHEY